MTKIYKHLFMVVERSTKRVLFEGIFESDTDDWFYTRHRIAKEYRPKIDKGIDWAVDSVLMDE